jgi:uncharacterized OsmC-like protein
MSSITIEYSAVEGTGAFLGRAGSHVLLADRPVDKAGGSGLGFNGGELLALSLGGCFCNDVHYTAEELGLQIARLRIKVTIDLEGIPLVVQTATVTTDCELADEIDATELLERARERCTVANSLTNGVHVNFV